MTTPTTKLHRALNQIAQAMCTAHLAEVAAGTFANVSAQSAERTDAAISEAIKELMAAQADVQATMKKEAA